eukprot:TRINITY_DN20737_c0_g1_i1.p1 TRINITY_DN20737_c0_g1~~TRINITY_DN20737_c0_g1_i1.p1  ORF type:complete len:289 (+),score=63.68 TRINITY_DN20737_c0_g1_i1:42-869(+)
MFRNQYDNDITTWSPQGRIHQIDYAMEAVKQGSATVALKSKTHAVVCSLNRSSSELSAFQKKIFKIDDHIGIGISGLTADARSLCKFMRTEALNHNFVYESPLQVSRLAHAVADKCQVSTQRYGRRPYGVGLLVVGFDQAGSHLYYNCPSGNLYDYYAYAIGARSQSARTYLEKTFEEFGDATVDQLIMHGLQALKECVQDKKDTLTIKNCAVAVVGLDHAFALLGDVQLQDHLDALEANPPAAAGVGATAVEDEPAPAAQDDPVVEDAGDGTDL